MDNKNLATRLMRADSADVVVNILEEAGYWHEDRYWRYLGDMPTNFSSIGNQQSDPVASLVEKIINGVDARLMNACLEQNIDPESKEAPNTMQEAVSRFFEGGSDARVDGKIRHWSADQLRQESSFLTVAATGHRPGKGDPCITIADQGEGQTPDEFPNTFLSLQKGNKNKIQFVQGKYNMGGTGALNFCAGPHRLQLIISRRNPALLKDSFSERDSQWGFTVVRREKPVGNEKNSTFTYLAPIGSSYRKGEVLTFVSDAWPLFPDGEDAYCIPSKFGTLVKLYEYDLPNKSNIVSSETGLFRRLDLGMPEIVLPVKVFECRPGYGGTAEGVIDGLIARLEEDRSKTLEPGFPQVSEISDNQKLPIRIYAFKHGQGKHYRTSDTGIVFTLNGQTHASLPRSFYSRKSVGMSYLADSLLLIADCSELQRDKQEELFMASRDRMRKSAFSKQLEDDLVSLLNDNPALKELRNRRRKEQIGEQLSDDKPLQEILSNLVSKDPNLAKLLMTGNRISAPFVPGPIPNGDSEFEGRKFPTFFKFKKIDYGEIFIREGSLGSKIRFDFITDAVNDYFGRDIDPGQLTVTIDDFEPKYLRLPLRDGSCSVNLVIPERYVEGDIFEVQVQVTDQSRIEPFINIARVTLRKGRKSPPGPRPNPPKFADKLSLPKIIKVKEDKWANHDFNAESGLVVKSTKSESRESRLSYDFYVNVDNIYLKSEQKSSKIDSSLLEARFVYGLVLFAMAILRDPKDFKSLYQGEEPDDLEGIVKHVSKSLARIILPVFNLIFDLSDSDYFDE